MNKPTVLVTGSSGCLGQTLLLSLRSEWPTYRVVGISRHPLKGIPGNFYCDLTKASQVKALCERLRPAFIFHAAGTTSPGPWSHLHDAHIRSTLNLLLSLLPLSLRKSLKKIVIVGSAAEYGNIPKKHQPIQETEPANPTTPYGLSKYVQSQLGLVFSAYGLPIVIARVFNLIGTGLSPNISIGRFQTLIQRHRSTSTPIHVGPLGGTRDFIEIREACKAITFLALRGKRGEIYNVCSGHGINIRSILNEMLKSSASSLRYSENHFSSERSSLSHCVGNPSKIYKHTGWRPQISWQEAVRSLFPRRALA